MSRPHVVLLPVLAGLMCLNAGEVSAQGAGSGQAYPTKPIRIVTSPAGGGGDFTARLIAQAISGPLGQPVIIDNRGPGFIPGEVASKAPPDGYTLLVNGSTLWVFPLLRKAPYDPVRDFAPIAVAERTVFIVAVHPSMPAKSIKELISLAKARPGELNYGSGSVGSTNHLGVALFASMAGINIVHVPSKGPQLAITAQIGGETQLTIFDAGLLLPHVKSGRLRALAVTSADPSVLVPGVPTVAASGIPGYQATGTTAVLAPANTPTAIITRLNEEIVRGLNRPEIKQQFLNAMVETVASSPEQLAATMKSDMAKMSKVIQDAGIKVE